MTFEDIYTKAIMRLSKILFLMFGITTSKSMMIRSLLLSQNQRWKMVNTLNTS